MFSCKFNQFWFQEWVPLFVNNVEKNFQPGQIYQDIKTPIIKKHKPVIHVIVPLIQNEVWWNIKKGFIARYCIPVTNVFRHLPANHI